MSGYPWPENLDEMFDQGQWYAESSGTWLKISEMREAYREGAMKRLMIFASSFASSYFSDLYAYSMPNGDQASFSVEQGEDQAEHILSSPEAARDWIAQTPLYLALAGEPKIPPMMDDRGAQSRMEVGLLDQEILRLEQVLTYLRELRERLL